MSIKSLDHQKQNKNPNQESQFSLQNQSVGILADEQQTPQESYMSRNCQRNMFYKKDAEIELGLKGDMAISNNSLFFENNYNNQFQENVQQNTEGNIREINCSYKDRNETQVSEQYPIVYKRNDNSQDHNFQIANSTNKKIVDHINSNQSIKSSNKIKLGVQDDMKKANFGNSQALIQDQIQSKSDQQIKKVESRLDLCQKQVQKCKGWIPEDIIYEKNIFELNRKVTLVVKNNFNQSKIQNYKERKYQQNFQKAAEIVNKLLNTSMNRIMRVRQHVRNFILFLKLRYLNRKIDDLTDSDYMSINDLSNFYKSHKKKKSNKKCMKQLNFLFNLSQKIPIFMPTDTLRVVWDVIFVLFTYIFLYFYSILMFFNQDNPDTEFIKDFFFCTFFIFIMDVLVNFNTAFFDKDLVIVKRRQIAKQYFFSNVFFSDFVSLMVLGIKVIKRSNYIVYNPNHDLLTYCFNLLIFLKANGISVKKKRFDYVFTLKENEKHVVKLINQLFSVVTVAHIAAIGWYFLGVQEIESKNELNWLEKLNISQEVYYQKYIYSVYWSITTMTTVGYGDISATNYGEALYISIIMLLFSCVFAYSINNIGFILQEIEKSSKQLNDKITTMQRYLNRKKVNISLKSRIRHYLSFLAQEQKDRDKQAEDEILQILSNKLREEITVEINSKILNKQNIFSSNFSKQTLDKLVFKMTEVLINPNEIIFREEQSDDMSIYFIQSGMIEIYQQQVQKLDKPSVIKTLTDENLFGEISFFSGLSRKASARSLNLSTLYKISREDFIEVIQDNNEDYERFKMMQEQIIFQGDLSLLHIECYNCQQVGHISNQCPKTHQTFDRQFIILRDIYSRFQQRKQASRTIEKNYFKPLNLIQLNKEMSQRLKQDLYDENSQIQNMFDSDKYTGSSYFNSEDQDSYEQEFYDDEEEVTTQRSQTNADNISQASSNNLKQNTLLKKQISKKKEVSKKYLDSNLQSEDMTSILNPEIQSNTYKMNSHLVNENIEQKKNQIKNLSAVNRGKSLEDIEQIKSYQVIQSNNIYFNSELNNTKSQTQTKTESDLIQQNINDQSQNFQIEEQEQVKETLTAKKTKTIKSQESSLISCDIIHQKDYSKQQIKRQSVNSTSLQQMQLKQSSFKVQDEIQSYINNSSLRGQELNISQSNKRISILLNQIGNNQNITTKSNQEQTNYRNSIDQILLQGILVNNIIQSQSSQTNLQSEQSFKFTKNFDVGLEKKKNSVLQQNLTISNKKNSMLQIKEVIEEEPVTASYKNLAKLRNQSKSKSSIVSALNNINQKDINNAKEDLINNNNNNQQQLESQQFQVSQVDQRNELQLVERLSKLLLNPQLPLLLQLTSGMSFREMTNINNNNPMDMFDKMHNFKKFFPHNNIETVLNKLKIMQQELKKIKKQKIINKPRRQNILFSRFYSSQQYTHNNLKFFQQEFNIDDYRPTYLSYGVSMRRGLQFPSNNHNLTLYF